MESEQDSLKGLKQTWLNPSDGFAATFFSENGNPFVSFADISPNRGITFQGRQGFEGFRR